MTVPALWTSQQAAAATGGRVHGDWQASGISIDSRTLRPGDLFVAIKGPRFDGHEFIASAFAAGAAAVVAHRIPKGVSADARLLLVEDTFQALNALAQAARDRSSAAVIGITGSVGKTSVKEALRTVLDAQAPTFASEGNLNNHWGLPLSLARMPADAAFAVLEMGMNHAGELTPLSRLARLQVAVITTVAAVHRGHFASVEAIADAKAEIFAGVEPGGVAVLNRDGAYFARLEEAARRRPGVGVLSFGREARADVRLLAAKLDAEGAHVRARVGDAVLDYRINLPGSHWVDNSLCVLAAASAAGADVRKAAEAVRLVRPLDGRGRRFTVRSSRGSFVVIDDSYNASPTSMEAAFEVLARTPVGPSGRRVAVLGDMLELGEETAALHVSLANPLRARGIDLVYLAGPAMAHLFAALPPPMRGAHAGDAAALAPLVAAAVRAGDVLVVKGSAGSCMGTVVKALAALESNSGNAPATGRRASRAAG